MKDTQRFLPIIPLVGKAKNSCFQAKWPQYTSQDLAQLTEQIESRVDIVFDRLVKQHFQTNNLLIRFGAKFVLNRKKKEVVELIKNKITSSLKKMQLM
jgi:hypothetical protein